ncbi:DUF4433 domain-containing protein [Chloroflexales bacterium ZM16-3]|nr:DUF4433 domain-containing protein [Chloroflexales bacterium ZM16-3]
MTAIYHITHGGNLTSILHVGGLWCDAQIVAQGIAPTGIAHEHIKERRTRRAVPCGPGGTIAEYVPFYFAPRSPMLGAIHTGRVAGYQGGQRAVIHLVAEAEAIASTECAWVFTDGHAEIALSQFSTDLAQLSVIDWAIMREKYWRDTDDDGDRKRRRQAEFLVHRFCPWALITEIGVLDTGVQGRVEQLLTTAEHKPMVSVRRDWYY